MRQIILFITVFSYISCSTKDNVDNYAFEYDYEVKKYYGDTLDIKNLRQVDYYDSSDKIVRTIGTEIGCTRYLYDVDGKLKEKVWSRNCSNGRRHIMIYDSSKNLIGTYTTTDSLVDLDTIKYQRSFIYDNSNRLIKELKMERKDTEGNKYQIWATYTYDGERIIGDTIRENDGLLWTSRYEYNQDNKLTAIYRVRRQIFKNELFKYNDKGLLIEKQVKGNEYPITPKVSFSDSDNRTIYRYDLSGRLTEETLLSHMGKVHVKTIWTKGQRID